MLFYKNISDKKLLLGIWKTEETLDTLQKMLAPTAFSDEQLSSFSTDKRKLEWLTVRVLLKDLLNEEKEIAYKNSGKPYLKDNSYQISISHTKNFVAVLLHPSLHVGLDIEQRGERALRIKERFLSVEEINSLDKSQPDLHSLLCWSAKETLFKIVPETEIDFINHLHIFPFQPAESGSFPAKETRSDRQDEFEIQYRVFEDFVLTFTSK
jgi:phosphopantetheinyl transferase